MMEIIIKQSGIKFENLENGAIFEIPQSENQLYMKVLNHFTYCAVKLPEGIICQVDGDKYVIPISAKLLINKPYNT